MTKTTDHVPGNLSPDEFLENYWQQHPCLIQQAIPQYRCPLTPDELAGLACEPDISSRIVIENPDTATWKVMHGPFTEQVFSELPDSHWTLLVQSVDRYIQPVNELLQHFSFIPNWRIDDVMISYAADQGTVGPHLDSYDVFLLQGLGSRLWQVNADDYTEQDLVPDHELRIIRDFCAANEWTLHPGDMLYLPPGVAHNGIANGPCMTLSIGFLAPAYDELVHDYIDTSTDLRSRYTDPRPGLQPHCGEISQATLATVRQNMRALLADDQALDHWFGKYITGLHDTAEEIQTDNTGLIPGEFKEQFSRTGKLFRKKGLRTAYIHDNDQLTLYINGSAWCLDNRYLDQVQMITGQMVILHNEVNNLADPSAFLDILYRLYSRGFYSFACE